MSTDNIYAQVKRSVEWLFRNTTLNLTTMFATREQRIDYACANIPGASCEMIERAVDEIEAEARK